MYKYYASKQRNKEGKIRFSNKASLLDATTVEKIFDRYYTVESAKKSTGLGLSIAKQLVELNGGTITGKFENGKLTKNIEKYVVSSNVIGIQDTYTNVTYAKIPKPINSANYGNYSNTSVLFTHATFKVKTWSSWDTLETIGVISSNASSNEYWIGFPKGTTLDEMKTKLDETILYYRLKESQIYELPYEQLKLHKEYNYITLNDELYSNMEIEYLTDSILNATYETRAEHRIENDKIISELNSKVSDNELGEVVTEINNTFEQKISDSEVSTMSSINAKFKNYSNTTEMNNAINQKVTESENSINLSVSQKIENIQIGGTNLLPGSQLLDSDKITIKNALKQNDYKDFNSASGYSTSATYIDVLKWNEVLIPESSKEYTLSFYAKKYPQATTGKVTTYFFPNCVAEGITSQGVKTTAADGVVNFNLTNEWKRYWVTYKTLANVSGAKNILFRAFKNYGSSICGVKLEEGNKASDWSPAPEDMATNKSVEASLELKVGNNEYNKIVSMLNAAADEINLKGGSKINITTAGKLIISAGNFQLDEEGSMTAVNGTFTGTINATSGKIGKWVLDENGDMCRDVGNFRTYIQGADDGGANTWAFSTQEKNSKGGYDSRFIAFANGNVEVNTASNRNAYLSINCENRESGDVRFIMNTSGHYGIYDSAFHAWREYFSNDGSINQWILPKFGVNLSYFFTAENLFMFRPSGNGDTHLGGSKWRWLQLWSVNATNITSDENEKRAMLEFIAKDNDFFDKLKPISFYRKKGDRRHFGFGAQTVEKALKEVGYTSEDFAGLCFDKKTKTVINEEGKEVEESIVDENGNEELMYSLRYEEFISLNTWQIQLAKKRISNLEDTVKKQQEIIDTLIKRLDKLEKIEEGEK